MLCERMERGGARGCSEACQGCGEAKPWVSLIRWLWCALLSLLDSLRVAATSAAGQVCTHGGGCSIVRTSGFWCAVPAGAVDCACSASYVVVLLQCWLLGRPRSQPSPAQGCVLWFVWLLSKYRLFVRFQG